eukprot:GHVO01049119.1.p1 GENE.GHVO01049119.1~~GHVO01049119.1.p1  ORF type:complete len:106 (-),score=13.25 GHVO01049119.1:49-366(-)
MSFCESDTSSTFDVDEGECRDSSFEYESDGGPEATTVEQLPVYGGNCYMFEPIAKKRKAVTESDSQPSSSSNIAGDQHHQLGDTDNRQLVTTDSSPSSRLGYTDW